MSDDWATLVSVEKLAEAIGADDLIVIDARFSLSDPDAGDAAWRAGHVPRAIHAHLDRDLSGATQTGAGRHPWPTADAFTATLSRWGITPEHRVVVYDAADGAFASRVWFLLRSLGHRRVAVLDGGWAQWSALRCAVSTDTAQASGNAERYVAQFDQSRLLDAASVQTHLDSGGLLVDARAAERFRGDIEPIDAIAGHVPGAINRPYADNLRDGLFKPRAELRRDFAALVEDRAAEQSVMMCGSGVTACHHLLAMAHADLSDARLFTGSWSGWISDRARPVATGD